MNPTALTAAVTALTAVVAAVWRGPRPADPQLAAADLFAARATAAEARLTTQLRRLAADRQFGTLLDAGALTPVDTAPDPGNPGAVLRLVTDTYGAITIRGGRVLLVTNAPTGEGGRTRHAIPVPPDTPTALAAAAWTYGVIVSTYAALARRT